MRENVLLAITIVALLMLFSNFNGVDNTPSPKIVSRESVTSRGLGETVALNYNTDGCPDPAANAQDLFTSGGFRSLRCPDPTAWLNKFASLDPNPDKLIVVVGCNKGVDAAKMLAQYDFSPKPFRLSEWQTAVSNRIQDEGACGQVLEQDELAHARYTPPTHEINPKLAPEVHCIEAMPANYEMLKSIQLELGLDKTHGGQSPAFVVSHYAAGASTYPREVPFPNGKAGGEASGVGVGGKDEMVPVRMVSVDSLFANDIARTNRAVDMLMVDTEGNDPMVLLGATRTLMNTRYLEFENHKVGVWATFELKHIVDFLDNLGFDCYWASDEGKLLKVTRCWSDRFGRKGGWSNLVCAKRGDVYWDVLAEINREQS